MNNPDELIKGSALILTSPANLLTEYCAPANVGKMIDRADVTYEQQPLSVKLTKSY